MFRDARQPSLPLSFPGELFAPRPTVPAVPVLDAMGALAKTTGLDVPGVDDPRFRELFVALFERLHPEGFAHADVRWHGAEVRMVAYAAAAVTRSWAAMSSEGASSPFERAVWVELVAMLLREDFEEGARHRAALPVFLEGMPGATDAERARLFAYATWLMAGDAPFRILPANPNRLTPASRRRLRSAGRAVFQHFDGPNHEGAKVMRAASVWLDDDFPVVARGAPSVGGLDLTGRRPRALSPPPIPADELQRRTDDANASARLVHGVVGEEEPAPSARSRVADLDAVLGQLAEEAHWSEAELESLLAVAGASLCRLNDAARVVAGADLLSPCAEHPDCLGLTRSVLERMVA